MKTSDWREIQEMFATYRTGGHFQDTGKARGNESPVTDLEAFHDRQTAAAWLGDLTLDSEFNVFIPVPNTPDRV